MSANPKRRPLTNDERHRLVDAIDAIGGVLQFSKSVALSTSCIGHALNGEGILPASAKVLREAGEAFVFGLAAAARHAAPAPQKESADR